MPKSNVNMCISPYHCTNGSSAFPGTAAPNCFFLPALTPSTTTITSTTPMLSMPLRLTTS